MAVAKVANAVDLVDVVEKIAIGGNAPKKMAIVMRDEEREIPVRGLGQLLGNIGVDVFVENLNGTYTG